LNPWFKQFDYAVFDCDGVILDSNEIKTQAFRESLPEQPEDLVDELVSYHQATGGISRYVKLEYFFKNLKGEADDSKCRDLVEEALELFGTYCYESLVSCDEILGVRNTLTNLTAASIPMAVVSGAAEHELCRIFEVRGLSEYFEYVLGSPKTKIENMKWLKEQGFLCGNGVFFGDSRSDLDAAQYFGLEFVFVRGRSEWEDGDAKCQELGCRVVDNFESARSVLGEF